MDDKQRVDDVLIRLYSHYEDLSSLRRQLDMEMRNGFLHMAKARIHAGYNNITSLQHETSELSATVTVEGADADTEQLQLIRQDPALHTKTVGSEDSQSGTESTDEDSSEEEEKEESKYKDPLLMFGVLVPQSLRSSKTCFQRTINILIEICKTQRRIQDLSQDYGIRIDNIKT